MGRPELNNKISGEDFASFYWLKEELIAFCKTQGINATGSKSAIALKINSFLKNESINLQVKTETKKAASKFNWKTAALALDTILTDNFKKTENVREFMIAQVGNHFHFTIDFMKWAKQNAGKTLNEAIVEWNRQYALKKNKNYKTEIARQFEYNRYMRAFLADNPAKTTKDAIKYWKLKKTLRGDNEYSECDLDLSHSQP